MQHDLAYYIAATQRGISRHSRTVAGKLDTTSSQDKSGVIEEGMTADRAARLAEENVIRGVIRCWDYSTFQFDHPGRCQRFVEELAGTANAGITKAATLLRTGDNSTKHPEYGDTAKLPRQFADFCEELGWRLHPNLSRAEAVNIACWSEWLVNMSDHYFADGCGRISKLLTTFVLMRADCDLPNYPDYGGYYGLAPKTRRDPRIPLFGEESDPAFREFQRQYRSWFS